ncbi:hypothetical protein D3C75_758090 [compost metagenome]
MKQHGGVAGADLAGPQTGDGALHRLVGDPLRGPETGEGTAGGVAIVALHVPILLADQHAAQGVARRRIAFDEAMAVAIDLDSQMA